MPVAEDLAPPVRERRLSLWRDGIGDGAAPVPETIIGLLPSGPDLTVEAAQRPRDGGR